MNNSNAKKLNDIMSKIEILKSQLKEQEQAIAVDASRSEDWKRSEVKKARATTAEMISSLYEGTGATIEALKADSAAHFSRFDYSDPKLQGALNFIKISGNSLPEAAWRQMISDFSDKPAVLRHLATAFDENKVAEASMCATEQANLGGMDETFAQRLDDCLFFATTSPAESSVDFSGYRSELESFDSVVLKSAEGGGNE